MCRRSGIDSGWGWVSDWHLILGFNTWVLFPAVLAYTGCLGSGLGWKYAFRFSSVAHVNETFTRCPGPMWAGLTNDWCITHNVIVHAILQIKTNQGKDGTSIKGSLGVIYSPKLPLNFQIWMVGSEVLVIIKSRPKRPKLCCLHSQNAEIIWTGLQSHSWAKKRFFFWREFTGKSEAVHTPLKCKQSRYANLFKFKV